MSTTKGPIDLGGRRSRGQAGGRPDGDTEIRPPEFSDDSLAVRFANRHAGVLRYVAAWTTWLHFTGGRWQQERTRYAFDLARAICREGASVCSDQRVARAIASAKTAAAVERMAQADRRIAATVDQWDADPWMLNTPGGAVDLRTGLLHPHEPTQHLTKIVAVAPDPDCKCPVWQGFLHRVTAGDLELVDYLQRLAGYILTGSTAEQILAFLFGTGANGKSVFITTVSGILADYAKTLPVEALTMNAGDRHPTEIAMLRGSRLAVAMETEEGRSWAESRIKTLTGGDKLAARFMRADFFEYVPQFKLIISGNHKPSLRTVDEAIRRRFHLVPFGVTIPPEERDPGLADKLKAEWPGILQWMIEGALAWQSSGLKVPPAVRDATDAYLEAEDAFGAWFGECLERRSTAYETTAELFHSWKQWAERAGEAPGAAKRFSQQMLNRGIEPRRQPGTGRAGFAGIRLVRASYADDPRCGS
jgi:putative DNA primase/helicase